HCPRQSGLRARQGPQVATPPPAGPGVSGFPMNNRTKQSFRWSMALILGLAGSPAFGGPPQVYKAARIWSGDGPAIVHGVLIVRDGKVGTVGPRDRVTVPEDAEVHDLGSAVLIPGLVIAETT